MPTSRLSLPYPQGTDVADVPSDVQVLAESLDATVAAWSTGTEAGRPTPGTAGRWYLASDSGVLYLDTGAAWLRMGPPELATPPGFIGFTAASAAPAGWLERNGQAVSRSTFGALFAAIGTTYGAGDGSTTFNLPDARGRIDMGAGQGPGLTSRERGQKPGAEGMPEHEHDKGTLVAASAGGHDHPSVSSGNLVQSAAIPVDTDDANVTIFPWVYSNPGATRTGSDGTHGHSITGRVGTSGSGSHGVIQPSGVYLPVIKT